MRLFAHAAFDGHRFLRNVLVVIDRDVIGRVEPDQPPPTDSETLVVGAILPGLIDAHTHLVWDATFGAADRVEREGTARTLIRVLENAQQHLRSGVTTVRDLGSSDGLSLIAAEAMTSGTAIGPRIVAAGRALGAPQGFASALCRPVQDVADAVSAVDEQLVAGAKVIKLMASGGIHEPGDEPRRLALDIGIVAAVVAAATAAGTPVAAHAHHPDVIGPLVSAGVSSIEHGTLLDRQTARMMAAHGTALVPTLSIYERVAAIEGLDQQTRDLYEQITSAAQAACRTALEEGVTIVAGTDAGGPETPHGSIAHELQLLTRAGLSREATLAAATSSAARLLGVHDETGRLAPGLCADLVCVDQHVTSDLAALAHVAWVMRSGRITKMPEQGS